MKKFVGLAFLFLILLLGILELQKTVLNRVTSPFWGNSLVRDKVGYLIQTDEKFDLIAIGSSLTERHIDPTVFQQKLNLKTFNLGCPGMRHPETWFVLEKFLETIPEDKKPRFILLELQDFGPIQDENMQSNRTKYFLDSKRMKMTWRHYKGDRLGSEFRNYLISYFMNELKIGLPINQLSNGTKERSFEALKNSFAESCGYHPFSAINNSQIAKRREEFTQDPKQLFVRKERLIEEYSNQRKTGSKPELRITEMMIQLIRENGIEPIIIKPVKKGSVLNIYNQLDGVKKIDMSNPAEYPEFYTLESAFDTGHLNEEYSSLYSRKICEKLESLLTNE